MNVMNTPWYIPATDIVQLSFASAQELCLIGHLKSRWNREVLPLAFFYFLPPYVTNLVWEGCFITVMT